MRTRTHWPDGRPASTRYDRQGQGLPFASIGGAREGRRVGAEDPNGGGVND